MSKEKCGSENGVSKHHSGGGRSEKCSFTLCLTGAEAHDHESDAAHIGLEHLNGKVNFTEELNEAHCAEYQNPSANSFTVHSTNQVQRHLQENESCSNNLEGQVTIFLKCTLSPALLGELFNWCIFNFI